MGATRLRFAVLLKAFQCDGRFPERREKVKIVTTKTGKGQIRLTPLDEQPETPNIVKLTATLVHRWPMINLLDILKET